LKQKEFSKKRTWKLLE